MTAARCLSVGQTVRVEHGPKAGHVGTVDSLTVTVQFGTNFEIAIIDFADGSRSVQHADDELTVVPAWVQS